MGRTKSYTLPELLVKKTRLGWYTATGIVALLFVFGLIITAFIDETPISQLGWNFWRVGLQGPAIIAYILVIYPHLTRMGDNAVESIIPMLNMDKKEIDALHSKYHLPNRRNEWLSLAAGAVFISMLSQPWRGMFNAVNIFLYIIEIIMFGLLALLIYYGFHNSRYITQINKNLKLDIFSLDALAPIARWSLSVSLAFVGGIMISIVFQTIDALKQWQIILIYLILILCTVVMFFVSMWSTHVAITRVKKRELKFVQNKLAESCRKLMTSTNDNYNEGNNSAHYEVAAWGLYERRIRETREWPYNAAIIGRLVLSIVSPAFIYLIKLISGLSMGM